MRDKSLYHPVAARTQPTPPLTVIDPEQWEPCSPAYLAAGGCCATAPRVWHAASCNHWHPKLATPPAQPETDRLGPYDAVARAMDMASLLAGSVAMNDTFKSEAYSSRLRSHLVKYMFPNSEEVLRRDLARSHESANSLIEQIGLLNQEVRELKAFRAMVNRHRPEFPSEPDGPRDVWYWQGDHMDHLESMTHTLPIVIRAEQLRELLAANAEAQPAPVVPATHKLVPIEPTEEMQIAGALAHQRSVCHDFIGPIGDAWDAMLQAAQKAE